MRAEYFSTLFLVVISLLVCVGARRLNIGSFGSPGPGFFPFVLGLATGALSLVILFKQLFQKREAASGQQCNLWTVGGRRVICVLVALVGYGLLLQRIGYVFTTCLVFGFLLRAVEPQKWTTVVIGSIIVAGVSYILFALLLGISLPQSRFGI
ncbi:MAG: tripartite tricarboxylate transporter TctB family protein [Proteobacteria bacterium]|nr:tripartite tricarboxylate transporter TctB family protein [Pseudomonadota bacterium]